MDLLRYVTRTSNVVLFILLIADFGFRQNAEIQVFVNYAYWLFCLIIIGVSSRFYRRGLLRDRVTLIYISVLLVLAGLYGLAELPASATAFLVSAKPVIVGGLLVYFIISLSGSLQWVYRGPLNPALVFVFSFAILILLGTAMLELPLATRGGISFVDALFTATSAVCVTGLASLDTGKDFTQFGQTIILILIQLGGLGILTITSFFAYFFRQGSTFREGIYLKNFLSAETFGGVLRLAAGIVAFTLTVELIGAVLIYFSLPAKELGYTFLQRVYFSMFHSVSSYCNAGFSTLSLGLYDEAFRFNYSLQWIVACLFILGGLGFYIFYNAYVYLRENARGLWGVIRYRRRFFVPPRLVTLNTKIVVYTTLILLVVGTLFIFFVEYNNTLREHSSLYGKFTTAFFTGTVPRTAGFNVVDMTQLTTPAILIIFLLMWIGASPASTGGGIKTSTIAIATLNIFAVGRDKDRIEVGNREISRYSIDRAFAIICVSLIVIGFAVLFVSWFEPDMQLMEVAFECFSAYSTVGLSLGITPRLSDESKWVLVLTMFIGRIGTINLLVGMMRSVGVSHHRYPTENILIN